MTDREIQSKLIDLYVATFDGFAAEGKIVETTVLKSGSTASRFALGGWDAIKDSLNRIFEDFIVVDRISRANENPERLLNMRAVSAAEEGIRQLSPMTRCMTDWLNDRSFSKTEPKSAMYFDRPTEYNKTYMALQRISFPSIYPRIMVQMWSNDCIKSEDFFWLTYSLCVLYRTEMKLKLTRAGYKLLKMYINAGYGKVLHNGDSAGRTTLAMVVDYARHVMDLLVSEIGAENLVYADLDQLYVHAGIQTQSALSKLGSGLQYDVEYVEEMVVTGARSYAIKVNGEWEYHGRAKKMMNEMTS